MDRVASRVQHWLRVTSVSSLHARNDFSRDRYVRDGFDRRTACNGAVHSVYSVYSVYSVV